MPQHIEQHLYGLLVSLSGLVLGYLIEKIILNRFQKYALKTKWKYDDIIISSLRGLVMVWFMLIAHSIATNVFVVSDVFSNYLNKIVFTILIISLCVFGARILIKLFTVNNLDTGNLPSTSIILNIVRVIIFLIGLMLVLQVFGITIAPLLTALGVGGLAVALALQETLSNLFAGIQIIASKKIRNNDYVKLDSGHEGYILDITWRNTIIKTFQNNLVVIPNSKLSSAIITNYNFPETELSMFIDLNVSYESDLEFVEKITIETANELINKIDACVKGFLPVVRYRNFADSSIYFTLTIRVNSFENQFEVKHLFIKALHRKFKELGIEIPFPVRTVVLKKQTE